VNNSLTDSNDSEQDEMSYKKFKVMVIRMITKCKKGMNKHLNELKKNTNKQLNETRKKCRI
jgi:hypothetical protein